MRNLDPSVPTILLLLAALGASTLGVSDPTCATALCVAVAVAGLGLVRLSSRRSGDDTSPAEGGRQIPVLFTLLFLGLFAAVCYLSLAAGAGLLHRTVFLLLSLPLVVPSCALLSLSLMPSPPAVSAPGPSDDAAVVRGGTPLVSVILATRNEPFDVIRMTLESVLSLSYPAERLELLVTDNSDLSHPDLAALRAYLDQLAKDRPVRFLHRDGKEGAKARNLDLALAEAAGEHVLLVDADTTLAAESLRQAVDHMAGHARTAYVQFRMNTSNWRRNWFTFCVPYMTDVLIRGVEEMRSALGFAFNGGHNVLWRRRALDDVMPFEQRFNGVLCQTEDYCASIRAALAGWRCEMLGIDAWEWAPFDLGSYLKQWSRWGYGAQQGVLNYGRAVLRSDRMSYGGKLGLLMAFLHFLSPVFTMASSVWLLLMTVMRALGFRAPTGPGCVAYGLATGSLAMLILFARRAPAHKGAALPARLAGMLYASVVLFGLTTWITMVSTFAYLARKDVAWTITAKK